MKKGSILCLLKRDFWIVPNRQKQSFLLLWSSTAICCFEFDAWYLWFLVSETIHSYLHTWAVVRVFKGFSDDVYLLSIILELIFLHNTPFWGSAVKLCSISNINLLRTCSDLLVAFWRDFWTMHLLIVYCRSHILLYLHNKSLTHCSLASQYPESSSHLLETCSHVLVAFLHMNSWNGEVL